MGPTLTAKSHVARSHLPRAAHRLWCEVPATAPRGRTASLPPGNHSSTDPAAGVDLSSSSPPPANCQPPTCNLYLSLCACDTSLWQEHPHLSHRPSTLGTGHAGYDQFVLCDLRGPRGSIKGHLAMRETLSWLEVRAGRSPSAGLRKGGSQRRSGPGHSALETAASKHPGSQGTGRPKPTVPASGREPLRKARLCRGCSAQAEAGDKHSLGGVQEEQHTRVSEMPNFDMLS